jgi:hypothetical protein
MVLRCNCSDRDRIFLNGVARAWLSTSKAPTRLSQMFEGSQHGLFLSYNDILLQALGPSFTIMYLSVM